MNVLDRRFSRASSKRSAASLTRLHLARPSKSIAALFSVVAASLFALSCVAAAELTVNVMGASDAHGRMAVALFAQPDGFPKDDAKAFARQFVTIDEPSKTATAVFSDLAPGVYAVSVFHDRDKSGKLETGLFGIPLKGYGFSQNANPSMRAARFDETKFELTEPGAAIAITLIYR